MTRAAVIVIAGLALAGCDLATMYSRAQEDAIWLHNEAREYVGERDKFREEIRARCRAMLWVEVDELEEQGNFAAARARLAAAYPPWIPSEVARARAQEETLGALDTARECE